ncbi:MAG TPA: hypothetical protein VG672_13895 [Bryobacteraceae bacterium]|nr:hypothetical protein [Bryobacteraceae bacterium]
MRLPLFAMVLCVLLSAAEGSGRYALILKDPPMAERFHTPEEMRSEAAKIYRRKLEAAQDALRAELDRRQIRVTGASQVVSNALFVEVDSGRIPELRRLPGVKSVTPLRRMKRLE